MDSGAAVGWGVDFAVVGVDVSVAWLAEGCEVRDFGEAAVVEVVDVVRLGVLGAEFAADAAAVARCEHESLGVVAQQQLAQGIGRELRPRRSVAVVVGVTAAVSVACTAACTLAVAHRAHRRLPCRAELASCEEVELAARGASSRTPLPRRG